MQATVQPRVHTKNIFYLKSNISDVHISERTFSITMCTGLKTMSPQNLISFADYQNVALFEMGSLQT